MIASAQSFSMTGREGLRELRATRRLSDMCAGESAVILGISAEPRLAKRLADLGFFGGSRVEMIRPGRPCLVRVNGTRVGLGRRYQQFVQVDCARQG